MDIPGYISSGVLESYLLGLTSAVETKEVETFALQYPAIRIELNKIEDALNDYVSLYNQTPPAAVRDKIFSSVDVKYTAPPVVKNETKVVSISNTQSKDSSSGFIWVAAACIALLISAGYNFIQFQNIQTLNNDKVLMVEDLNSLDTKFKKQLAETDRINKNLEVLMKPGIKMIQMKGLDKSPSSWAMIYWNQNSNEVFLNIQSLPEPPADKQYQLWAIVAGIPVNMGVLDELNDKSVFYKMKEIENPEAFAVTIEKKGGNPTPTMEEMYLMGKNG